MPSSARSICGVKKVMAVTRKMAARFMQKPGRAISLKPMRPVAKTMALGGSQWGT